MDPTLKGEQFAPSESGAYEGAVANLKNELANFSYARGSDNGLEAEPQGLAETKLDIHELSRDPVVLMGVAALHTIRERKRRPDFQAAIRKEVGQEGIAKRVDSVAGLRLSEATQNHTETRADVLKFADRAILRVLDGDRQTRRYKALSLGKGNASSVIAINDYTHSLATKLLQEPSFDRRRQMINGQISRADRSIAGLEDMSQAMRAA